METSDAHAKNKARPRKMKLDLGQDMHLERAWDTGGQDYKFRLAPARIKMSAWRLREAQVWPRGTTSKMNLGLGRDVHPEHA